MGVKTEINCCVCGLNYTSRVVVELKGEHRVYSAQNVLNRFDCPLNFAFVCVKSNRVKLRELHIDIFYTRAPHYLGLFVFAPNEPFEN